MFGTVPSYSDCVFYRGVERVGIDMFEEKSRTVSGLRIVLRYRICEPARFADDRYGAVSKRIHLIKPARLVSAGHEKEIAAGLYEMRHSVIEGQVRVEIWKSTGESLQLFFAPSFSGT
jgi:hypothetical protein